MKNWEEKELQSLFYWKSFCNQGSSYKWIETVKGYNPYFIGNHSATFKNWLVTIKTIKVTILILLEIILQRPQTRLFARSYRELQSLFYWKSFCNIEKDVFFESFEPVTILILLEIILQHRAKLLKRYTNSCYNPYFIGNHSATKQNKQNCWVIQYKLQSLFYWKSFCNSWRWFLTVSSETVTILILLEIILQQISVSLNEGVQQVTILILLEIILQQ